MTSISNLFSSAGLYGLVLALGCGGGAANESTASNAASSAVAEVAEVVEAPSLGGIPERGDDAERASKNGETIVAMGSLTVTVRYGRPNVNGRTIWGELVPFDQVWRAGANEATTITFSEAVQFGGNPVDAGTYSFFAIPTEDTWTLILNRDAQQWGASRYNQGQDAARVTVTPVQAEAMEEMTFAREGEGLVLRWAELSVPVPVTAN